MKKFFIDINCDVGEGVGNEAELLPLISSCNISCGAHAGNEEIIRNTIKLAKKYNVRIGAHPSYPDWENFGRKVMDISSVELKESIQNQLSSFLAVLKEEEGFLHHIKPHGALYNQISKDKSLALVFLGAIEDYREQCALYVPYNSKIAQEALRKGYDVIYEAFGDRNYLPSLQLVPRTHPDALIEIPKKVLKHVAEMIIQGKVFTIDGNCYPIKAETICVHGDTGTALKILTYLNKELPNSNIHIQK